MIVGKIDNLSRPYVRGQVSLPRLGLTAFVHFLVDTGAGGTVIHPRDAELLSVDFGRFCEPCSTRGVGGPANAFREDALLRFQDEVPGKLYEYPIPVTIAEPSGFNVSYPSLLGRDVLKYWAMEYDPRNGIVRFMVH